jgi:hypothetical protein
MNRRELELGASQEGFSDSVICMTRSPAALRKGPGAPLRV